MTDFLPSPNAPQWFVESLASRAEDDHVTVHGCDIAFQRWPGPPGGQALVLVHGGGAHSGWWDHIGPALCARHTVLALDLSGHGDSGRRDDYPVECWADEIVAVGQTVSPGRPALIVAHSLGGWPAVVAAGRHPHLVDGLILVDSSIRDMSPEEYAAENNSAFGPLRTYPTLEAALARFRTVPSQPTSLPYVIDHVARRSLRAAPGGWTWKYDPKALHYRRVFDHLFDVTCRVAVLRAEHGSIDPDRGAEMYRALGRVAPIIEIPEAWHHIMLDQPLILITALRTLLSDWDHSDPLPRSDRGGGPSAA